MSGFKESFLRELAAVNATSKLNMELQNSIDERVNNQIAVGMKKVMHLLVDKFDKHVQEKLKIIVAEEVEIKLQEKEAKQSMEKEKMSQLKDNQLIAKKSKFSMFNKLATPLK